MGSTTLVLDRSFNQGSTAILSQQRYVLPGAYQRQPSLKAKCDISWFAEHSRTWYGRHVGQSRHVEHAWGFGDFVTILFFIVIIIVNIINIIIITIISGGE